MKKEQAHYILVIELILISVFHAVRISEKNVYLKALESKVLVNKSMAAPASFNKADKDNLKITLINRTGL